MSFFSNLQGGVDIYGGTFTQVEGNLTHFHVQGDLYHQHNNELGLQTLSKVIAAGALHDAAERSPPPKCHPDTRKKVLKMIMSWIENPELLAYIIWLYGPAGSGKSAIMQTIAELCRSTNNRLGATFFFSKGKPGREEDRLLFATIAYQLALYVPGLREHVNRAMLMEPTLHTKDIEVQLNALIIRPFQRLTSPPLQATLVVIDGLDECQGHETQRRILSLIAKTLATSNIPLRFLITSRPESHIRETFNQPHLDFKTRRIVLDSSFNPDHDIRLFLQDNFDLIANRNPAVMSKVEKPWPTKQVMEHLVEKSSGQFIYPATVLKFVGADLHHPIKQLEIVLKPAPVPSTLYSNIDQLYTQILDTCPYPEPLARILSLLLVLHCPQPPEVYEEILGFSEGDVTFTLHGLHSLIKFPNPEEDKRERREFHRRIEYDQTRGLRLHHATFRDFLLDKSRCPEQFFVDLDKAHAQLTRSGFKLILDWISSPWTADSNKAPPHRETWGYLKHHMDTHLDKCKPSERTSIIADINRFGVVFPAKRPLEDRIWDQAFDALHSLVTALAMSSLDGSRGRHHILNPANFHSEHSHWTQEIILDVVDGNFDSSKTQNVELYIKHRCTLDDFYKSALSSSNEILQLLNKLPGFVTRKKPVLFDWLEDVFGVDIDEISATMKKNRKFIHRWDTGFWTRFLAGHGSTDVVLLNPHFSSFLRDPVRAGSFYQDPEIRHLLDFRHIISMIFRPDWLRVPRQREALIYLDEILRSCLECVKFDPSEDYPNAHPFVILMEVLKHVVYDMPRLTEAPVLNVELIWSATRRLLDWIQRQIVQISSSKGGRRGSLKQRFIEISNGIYHQILEVGTSEGGQRTIAICKPFLVATSRSLVMDEPETPLPLPLSDKDSIRISETLLALHGLRSSLLSFLTKPERAGAMHISPEMYHTQLAEICLGHCDPSVSDITRDWRTLPSHTEWRFHLVRAKPSAKILAELRCIGLGPWLAEGLPTSDSEAKAKSIKAIIGWLSQMPKAAPDIYQRWQQSLVSFGRLKRRVGIRARTGAGSEYSGQSSHFRDPTS